MHTAPFHEAVRARRSVRGFLPTPLPEPLLAEVLEDARWTPSNCNSQPWNVHIVMGAKRDELSAALLKAHAEKRTSRDYGFSLADYFGPYAERQQAQGAAYYECLGLARDDMPGRMAAGARNLEFFGAPHAAFLFMPAFSDGVRVAADIGMYAQTFLLALAARGLAGVPQTMLSGYGGVVREVLGVPDDLKLLFGVSFGYEDPSQPANTLRMDRAPLDETVTFHR